MTKKFITRILKLQSAFIFKNDLEFSCCTRKDKLYLRILSLSLTSNGSKFLMLVKEKLIKEKTYHVKVLGKYFK